MAQPVKALTISDEERDELQNWLRRHPMPAAEQQRAHMILLSTEDLPARDAGERVGVSAETVGVKPHRLETFKAVDGSALRRQGARHRRAVHATRRTAR